MLCVLFQKLSMILQNKGVQKLKLPKNERLQWFLIYESQILALFDKAYAKLLWAPIIGEDGWFFKTFWMNGLPKVSLPTFMTLVYSTLTSLKYKVGIIWLRLWGASMPPTLEIEQSRWCRLGGWCRDPNLYYLGLRQECSIFGVGAPTWIWTKLSSVNLAWKQWYSP